MGITGDWLKMTGGQYRRSHLQTVRNQDQDTTSYNTGDNMKTRRLMARFYKKKLEKTDKAIFGKYSVYHADRV